ncbi:MAG: mandelate racemase/muconate lactonizing enzyme family protein [Terrimicrobiaceae bacterium]|nr:mandelate racemase/muconate lactonizing enzyme family protein [Terrimicrobiaceae bacterium]
MKITGYCIYVVDVPKTGRKWLFLKLNTDEGIAGFGECSWHGAWHGVNGRAAVFVEDLKHIVQEFVIGKSPYAIERLWYDFYLKGHASRRPGPISTSAFSAIEMACWDIVGKAAAQPVYNLLGGMVWDKLRSYSYLPGPHNGDPSKIAEAALSQVERGFTGIKIDPVGHFESHQMLGRLDEVESIIKAVRQAVGTRCDIFLGTHGQFDTHTAIRYAKRLEPYELGWFEEPVQTENIDELARVARATSIPISTGERLLTKFEFTKVLEKKAASILQMDPSSCGGILETKKIAAMADGHYAVIAPHMYGGPLSLAASIQVDTCSTNFFIQEYNVLDFHNEILTEPLQWKAGWITPPTRPGLGYELNEEAVIRHASNQVRG